jgi:hypothetical protein
MFENTVDVCSCVTVVTGAEAGAAVDVFQDPPGTYG